MADLSATEATNVNKMCVVAEQVGLGTRIRNLEAGGTSNSSAIYVDPEGAVPTLTAALALATATRNLIYMAAGEYTEAAGMTWPNVTGIKVIGDPGGTTIMASGSNPVFTINPTYTAATFEAEIKNVEIIASTQIGIKVNNTNMTKKLNIYLNDVGIAQDAGSADSIDTEHAGAEAVRIYARGCNEIEGLVDVDVANVDDRFRFIDCTLIGGFTSVGAYAAYILFQNCTLLTSGMTFATENLYNYVASVFRTDAGVWTAQADAVDQ